MKRAPRQAPDPERMAIRPLTADRWPDLVRLFGPRGACAGCWCMYWKRPRREYEAGKGAGNRRALRRIVKAGERPGLLAYDGDEPIAWCALARRDSYPRLKDSRILSPVDGRPVWSVTCLFVRRDYRRAGVTPALLRAAVDHVRRRGGRVVEGYPIDPKGGHIAAAFAWTGLASAFRRAGFREVARRSATRPIMRASVD